MKECEDRDARPLFKEGASRIEILCQNIEEYVIIDIKGFSSVL
jgi:hypothetical protein